MVVSARKAREKANRRNDILKAAKRVIGKSGVESMSMNQVARLAELNKATLYTCFSNKDDLIDAIVYEGLLMLEELFRRREADAATGLEKMLDLVRATFEFYREHPAHFLAMNHQEHRGPGAERQTPFSARGDAVAALIFARIREALELGMADGSIRADIDVDRFLVLFFAHTHGVMHTVFSKTDVYVDVLGLTAEQVESSALEFLMYYLERREDQ